MNKNLHSVLMVRPSCFRVNNETLKNNFFQSKINDISNDSILNQAIMEFDSLVEKIKASGIKVFVYQDNLKHDTPDSIFPNNWISFHQNKTIAIYPMFANNRRLERNEDVIVFLEKNNIEINEVVDYSEAEHNNLFLEGTGSMVLDRINNKAYCSLSERTNENLIDEFCNDFKFIPIIFNSFHTVDSKRQVIYHTNVMMCVAEKYVIICLDSIDNVQERKKVIQSLEDDNKELIIISENQLSSFAGNMIELKVNNDSIIIMSQNAYESLDDAQIKKISKYSEIISSSVDTIEKYGGGSVRCMIAEIFN
ncbi:MAG: arginine deiminase-related protein [Bacteroidetes bacterium]|nr:arginine deiminase-related protein [Bacteroidota bacterium]MDA1018594.1 arginine deiminase-related protein [Bacteroidota bacterium]